MAAAAAGGDAAAAAAAAAAEDRSAPFLAEDDDLDDSEEDEEEADEETDELEDEEDEDEEDQKPLAMMPSSARVSNVASSSPSNLASDPAIPSPNLKNEPSAGVCKANPSFNGGAAAATDCAAALVHAATENGIFEAPDRKRQKTEIGAEVGRELVVADKKPLAILEDSRRLFQRLFTDEDEIAILQGFLEFTSQRSATAAHQTHHHDTAPFYEQIKTRLQLDFNKNQLVEKLRRLKKKYRNIMSKMSSGKDYAFKSPHDQATFELSRRIWGSSIYSHDDDDPPSQPIEEDQHCSPLTGSDRKKMRRRGRRKEPLLLPPEAPVEVKVGESQMPTSMASLPAIIEETVRSCLSPLLKELLYSAVGGQIGQSHSIPLSNPACLPKSAVMEEKWKKQQILELEVYSKRMELVQDQIKLMLEELRKCP